MKKIDLYKSAWKWKKTHKVPSPGGEVGLEFPPKEQISLLSDPITCNTITGIRYLPKIMFYRKSYFTEHSRVFKNILQIIVYKKLIGRGGWS